MQIRVPHESIKAMLNNAGCTIVHASEKLIAAIKPMNAGRIHIRLRRHAVRYSLPERYYWLADIHFEKGIRPTWLFESREVRAFVEQYVKPFTNAEPKQESISLTIAGLNESKDSSGDGEL